MKAYSDREPELRDGDVFHTFVPADFVNGAETGQPQSKTPAAGEPDSGAERVIEALLGRQGSVTSRQVADAAHITARTALRHISAKVKAGEPVPERRGRTTIYRSPRV